MAEFKLWRPKKRDAVRAWMLSVDFQSAAQLVGGVFLVALFSLVPQMKYNLSCISMTLYIVMSLLVASDCHVGTKLGGSCLVAGSGAVGAVFAGALASAAKAIDWNPYTGHSRQDYYNYNLCYMLLGAAGLALLSIVRVGQDPPFLWAVGMISCLSFGIVFTGGQFAPPPVPPARNPFGDPTLWFWKEIVARVLLGYLIAQAVAILTGVLILPSYASVDYRGKLTQALLGVGQSLSKYASKLLEPEASPQGLLPSASPSPPAALAHPKRAPSGSTLDPMLHHLLSSRASGDALGQGEEEVGLGLAQAFSIPTDDDFFNDEGLRDDELGDEEFLQLVREVTAPILAPAKTSSSSTTKGGKGSSPAKPGQAAPQPTTASLANHHALLGLPVASYRVLIGQAKQLLAFAMVEPPFLTGYPIYAAEWGRLTASLEMVVTRVAGLEVVLDERRQELAECTLAGHLTVNIVPNLRVTFAQLAAGCVRLAAAIDPKTSPQERQRAVQACQAEPLPYNSSEARQALLLMLKEATAAYLSRVRAEMRAPAVKGSDGKKEVRILDGNRLRSVNYVVSLTLGVMTALEDLSQSTLAVLLKTHGPPPPSSSTPPRPPSSSPHPLLAAPHTPQQHQGGDQGSGGSASSASASSATASHASAAGRRGGGSVPLAEGMGEGASEAGWVRSGPRALAEGSEGALAAPTAAPAAPLLPATGELTGRGAEQPAGAAKEQGQGQGMAGKPGVAAAKAMPSPHVMWLLMAVTFELGIPLYGGLAHFFLHDLPGLAKPGAWSAALRSRVVQTYCKYYACLVILLMLLLGLAARDDTSEVRLYRPSIAMNAAVLSMTERVESSASKAAMWVLGTALGGTLGFLVMLSPNLATNPYAIMAVMCTFAFLVGSMFTHNYKLLVVLSLMCFSDIVLCQHNAFPSGCTDCHGSPKTYATRVLAVIMGSLLALLISQLVLPWSNSAWSLDTMGQALRQTHDILIAAYQNYYSHSYKALLKAGNRTGAAEAASLAAQLCGAPAIPLPKQGEPPASLPSSVALVMVERTAHTPDSPRGRNSFGDLDRVSFKGPGLIGLPPPQDLSELQAKVAGPLVQVQINLAAHSAVWQRGLLATPPMVRRLLHQHFALLDRLAALQTILAMEGGNPEEVKGSAFANIVLPLQLLIMDVAARLHVMLEACARILSGDGSLQAHGVLQRAILDLEQARLAVRRAIIKQRRAFHVSLAAVPDGTSLPYADDLQDLVRVLSFIHANVKLLDKAMQIARTVGTLDPVLEKEGAWLLR